MKRTWTQRTSGPAEIFTTENPLARMVIIHVTLNLDIYYHWTIRYKKVPYVYLKSRRKFKTFKQAERSMVRFMKKVNNWCGR